MRLLMCVRMPGVHMGEGDLLWPSYRKVLYYDFRERVARTVKTRNSEAGTTYELRSRVLLNPTGKDPVKRGPRLWAEQMIRM